ncbi:MAG: hypothetical protein HY934_06215 [Candidatus Firestonebacteria bacterium]|nr:hypothetical protein [Candidatus Firestonebacteria bacterium]
MKKILIIFIYLIIVFSYNTDISAYSFTFYDESNGGAASAEMNINIIGNTMFLTLNNTSSPQLLNGSGENSPGITKFGFDLLNYNFVSLQTWSLEAYKINNQTTEFVVIGGNPALGLNKWRMFEDEKINGISLDYLPSVYNNGGNSGGIDGALYNPEILDYGNTIPNGSNSYFFTTSFLTMNFDLAKSAPELDFTSIYVRMQNVGNGGSVKLNGTFVPPEPPVIPVVPEPGTMLMFGSILAGIAGFKIANKKSKC